MHPKQREKQREYERRDDVSALVVTHKDESEFHDAVREDLRALERGEEYWSPIHH